MDAKAPWQSKTLWSNAIMALAPLIPGAGDWVSAHPMTYSWAIAGLNMILRCISEKKISFSMDV